MSNKYEATFHPNEGPELDQTPKSACKVIWKYALEGDRTPLQVPKGAKFLSVDMQGPTLTAWALVDISKGADEQETRILHVYGTGHEIPVDSLTLRYLASVQDGLYVWHVFEEWTNDAH